MVKYRIVPHDDDAGGVIPLAVRIRLGQKIMEIMIGDGVPDDFVQVKNGVLVKQHLEVPIPVEDADELVFIRDIFFSGEHRQVFLDIDHGCVARSSPKIF